MSAPLSSFSLETMAAAVRFLSAETVEKARSGHPGAPMGLAEAATVLFQKFLRVNPRDPLWPNRDRFVLSNGHASALLYSLSYLCGYEGMDLAALQNFRQIGAKTAGHPEWDPVCGVEMTTGPLAQGLGTAVGMALGRKILAAHHGADLFDYNVYTFVGDGCLMEGLSQEAIELAARMRLNNLVVLWDNNGITIEGSVDLALADGRLDRFAAAGWTVLAADGHDCAAVEAAIRRALESPTPSLIALKTVIGKGAPRKAGTSAVHGMPLGAAEMEAARQAAGWTYKPFELPEGLRPQWQAAMDSRVRSAYARWQKTYEALSPPLRKALDDRLGGRHESSAAEALAALRRTYLEDPKPLATRQASQKALSALAPVIPHLIGGSADLEPSVLTRGHGQEDIVPEGGYKGAYIRYGIREHAMGAVLNGLDLSGAGIVYGGTFLVFADYMRPAIRQAALMRRAVIYVLTHDSIGVGEDGPTHQPVETLAALRCIPRLEVIRPADMTETLEAWAIALGNRNRPTALVLSRQALPPLRLEAATAGNKTATGGYVLAEAPEGALSRQITFLATGSEVSLVLEARAILAAEGFGAAVVSLPCFSRFDKQPAAYRREVLGAADGLRLAVEAAVGFGWERYLGRHPSSAFMGLADFGLSGPAAQVMAHFGLTAVSVAARGRKLIEEAGRKPS